MATHSGILAWKISWTEEPARLQSMGSQESDTTERLNNREKEHHERRVRVCKHPKGYMGGGLDLIF